MKTALQSVGYDMIIEAEQGTELKEELKQNLYHDLKVKAFWAMEFSVPVVILGMFFMDWRYANLVMFILTLPVVIWFGRGFFINAFRQAKHLNATMDTLVALSTGIAFLFSTFNTFFQEFWHNRGIHPHVYFEASSGVIAFILLGKVLEEKAKSNTTSAIKKLMGLQPQTVFILNNEGYETEIPISKVKVGDLLLVKPGDKIPVDGELIEGISFVDESMITGEPMAVEKKATDPVYAGTLNQKGSFKIKALKVGGETILAQIIKMVQQAQGSKAPVQKTVDKIAGIFVPIVMSISLLTFCLWMMFGGENALSQALISMVTVLVIACPCALGLATPTAIMVGMGKGAENGILIKDAESLELTKKIEVLILDKTGTITEGKPQLMDLFVNSGEPGLLKQILLTIEIQSEHPLAEAIADKLKTENIQPMELSHIESITGRGIKARVQGKNYFVGNLALMKENGIELTDGEIGLADQLQAEAKTLVYFSDDNKLLMTLALADKIKPTSKEAIQCMQNRGIEVYMLTGDQAQTARAVAHQTGLQHYKSSMMPSDKANFIKELQSQGKIVAMVGDGINDSQALAQADVSIAMGKGSDIAMDVAKMTLISSDLLLISKAINLSKLTVNTIHQNLFWAFIYNLIGIPIAAGILYPIHGFLLNPMIAGAAMALSSVSVVSNSIRLKFKKI